MFYSSIELMGIISRLEAVDIFRGAVVASELRLWSVSLLFQLLEAVEILRGSEVTDVFLEASEAATLRSVMRLAWLVLSD